MPPLSLNETAHLQPGPRQVPLPPQSSVQASTAANSAQLIDELQVAISAVTGLEIEPRITGFVV